MTASAVTAPELPDLDDAPALDILQWAFEEFFPDIAVACSMQDAVVVDLAVKIRRDVEVFFLQTNFHFQETAETARLMKGHYNLNLVELKPVSDPAIYHRDGYEACCADRKVHPLERYLKDKQAWVSGIRHADSLTRTSAHAVEWDSRREIVKVNPIIGWSDEDVAQYIEENNIIRNPLREAGYESIGCWPCTRPGEGRQGRWEGKRLECGIHSYEPSLTHPPDPY